MSVYKIVRYQPEYKTQWDAFVSKAKNATFLFYRDFMEYHSDRFEDCSIMVLKNDKVLALLPANKNGDTAYSHQGLTYGGLVVDKKTKIETTMLLFKEVLSYLETQKISKLEIKMLPGIYTDFPSEELHYIFFLLEAKLRRRDVLSVIDLSKPLSFSSGRKEGVKRGVKNKLEVKEVFEFESFWNQILIPTLEEKHQAAPVHTLEEITLLHQRFPKNIRQFNVYLNDTIVAGTTVFVSKNVAHSQYIAGNADKNQLGSLDFLHHYLLKDIFAEKKYFDFGISNENQGRNLNKGLSFWKESFGANTVVQDFYVVETPSHPKLDNVLI
tara:strand:- start:183440 stop:184417 length:978 start_codon:yes stop_codon:yes gene_type:complete